MYIYIYKHSFQVLFSWRLEVKLLVISFHNFWDRKAVRLTSQVKGTSARSDLLGDVDATQPADLLLRAEAALKRMEDEADNAEVTQDSRRELVRCLVTPRWFHAYLSCSCVLSITPPPCSLEVAMVLQSAIEVLSPHSFTNRKGCRSAYPGSSRWRRRASPEVRISTFAFLQRKGHNSSHPGWCIQTWIGLNIFRIENL